VARAAELVRGRPGVALIVAVELPSLTFQPDDRSMANLVSSVIFGDGAAAAVVADRPSRAGAEVVASRSVLFPDTLDYMGFDLRDTGFHIVLSPAIPLLVRRRFADEVAPLLDAAGGHARALRYLALHPGGTRILDSLAEALDVPPARLDASRAVLARCGNLSSASVLFVYEEAMRREAPAAGDLGLLAAFGPGFSAECSLFRWADAT
jgi:alkylresorcinol/alkylpyrone synthase